MKIWILGLAIAAGCSDTQNVGDQFTFHAPRWGVSIAPTGAPETPMAVARSVAIDSAGDVISFGQYNNAVDFGTTTLVDGVPQPAFYFGKRSGIDGNEMWTRGMFGMNVSIQALAVDAQNNVIIAGGIGDQYDFGGQIVHGDDDAYVAKYDTDGALVWARGLTPHSGAWAHDLAVSPSGQIYMVAYVNLYVQSPQGATLSQGDVIASYDSDGTLRWAYALPLAASVAATSDGGVVIGGVVEKTTVLGGTQIDLTHDGDCVVAKLDANGQYQWVHTFGEPGTEHTTFRFAVDRDDRVAAVASSDGEMPTEALIDASGVLWSAQAPVGAARVSAVATYQDLVLTAGTPRGPVDFGTGTMIGAVYLSARDATGALVDAKVYGDPTLGGLGIWSLATEANGAIAFSGDTQQPIDFGSGTLAGPTNADGANLILGIIDPP